MEITFQGNTGLQGPKVSMLDVKINGEWQMIVSCSV